MGWKAKLVKDNIKAALPFPDQLRRWKRSLSPYRPNAANTALALSQGLEQLALIKGAGVTPAGKRVVEFGSGWVPVIPLLFSIAGARRVIMTDVDRLMDRQTLLIAVAGLSDRAGEIAAALGIPLEQVRLRLSAAAPASSFDDLLERFSLTYQIPYDLDACADSSLDIVISRAVFEHISPPALEALLKTCRHKLSAGGVMCHIIDNSDHWEHGDKSISRVNFLKYPDPLWQLTVLNAQNYQNRLRHDDYLGLLARCGYQVVIERGDVDPGALGALRTLPLARRFAGRPPEILAALTSYIVAVAQEQPQTCVA